MKGGGVLAREKQLDPVRGAEESTFIPENKEPTEVKKKKF